MISTMFEAVKLGAFEVLEDSFMNFKSFKSFNDFILIYY